LFSSLCECLLLQKSASGTLYVDDGESYNYRNKKYLYLHFEFKDNTLTSSLIDKTDFPTDAWIERVVILGPPAKITKAKITSKSRSAGGRVWGARLTGFVSGLGSVGLETSYDGEGRSLTVRKPGVNIREPFTLKLL
jgi:alpha 1,3-glucosidase